MTDYWVSTKKHYCETCNCWISGHKVNIKNHEKSARHLENFKRLISESFKRREQETKDKEFIEKELKKLENVEKKYLLTLKKNDNLTQLDSSSQINTNNSSNKEYQKWVLMIHEDTGSLVFFNKVNNQITYEKPKDFYEKLPEYQTFSEQNGWFKYFDYNSNNFYYCNINTYEIIWQYSISTINNFINYIKTCEGLDKSKNLHNFTENIKHNMMSHNLYNQINLNNNNYYVNFPVNINQNNNFVYNNYNLINSQDKVNIQKIDNIEKAENKKEKDNSHIIINSNKKNSSDNVNNLDNTITTNSDSINRYKSVNETSFNSFDKICENKSELKHKANETSKENTTKIETENFFNLNEADALNKKDKMDNKALIEEKKIKNNLDKEKKKNIIDINFSSKKTRDIPSSSCDKKENKKDQKMNGKNTNYRNQQEESNKYNSAKCDETSIPGAWQEVQKSKINTISDEGIEDIFYNIKSNEDIEKEELEQLEENIRYEYSTFNEFYIRKKELENEELYLNKEFRFVNKPIYKKSIDKNLNKKVEFAKRNTKIGKNKKGILK